MDESRLFEPKLYDVPVKYQFLVSLILVGVCCLLISFLRENGVLF